MADKLQINPKLSPGLHAAFLAYCKEHNRTHSEVVEAALEPWLHPSEEGTELQVMHEDVRAMQKDVREMQQAFGMLLTMIEKSLAPPKAAAPPPVDTYWNLYRSPTEPLVPVQEEAAPDSPTPDLGPVVTGGPLRRSFSLLLGKR